MNQKLLQSCQLKITANLLKNVRCARSSYFAAQKERDQGNVKSKRQLQIQEIEEEIENTSEYISWLESTICQLKKETHLAEFEAVKEKAHTGMKYG